MATTTYVGKLTATSAGSIAASIDISSIPVGNWMLAVISGVGATATSTPSGWTSLIGAQVIGSRFFSIIAKIKEAEDTNLSWGITTSGYKRLSLIYGANAMAVANWIKGLAGVRNAANVVGGQSQQAGTSTTCVAPSVTTTKANTLVVSIFIEATTAVGAAPTISGAATSQGSDGGDDSSYIEQISWGTNLPSIGANGTSTATYDQTQANNGGAIQIAIPPVDDEEEPGLTALSGDGQTVKVFYIDSNGDVRTPNALIPVPNGYLSVDEMLNDHTEFYWAHRGGSASYPEHSLWAFTQSVVRRFGGLECSLARTSDGVWFGLHDEDINRTSGLAAGNRPAASAMTWAQVQAYQITIGASGAPQPYMELDDLLNAYGKSHVIIIDPKYATAYTVELMNKLQTFYGSDAEAVKHVIMKSFGVGSSTFRAAVQGRGYKTWGYFYNTNSADYSTYAPGWDILGLNYDADQSFWDQLAVAGPGKRIVAHICPTTTAVNTGRTKGATGFQCSAPAVISPDNR